MGSGDVSATYAGKVPSKRATGIAQDWGKGDWATSSRADLGLEESIQIKGSELEQMIREELAKLIEEQE